ncbi:MAG: hypothetical protein ACOWWO_15705 [Peptococcaceae bacterium]|nr:MAG: hypothetical protein APR54_07990 [Candidatus Cloacimonas sp. SDB]
MPRDGVRSCCQIPQKILQEYEGWQLCKNGEKVEGKWQYDDQDLEYLSMILTLYDVCFSSDR